MTELPSGGWRSKAGTVTRRASSALEILVAEDNEFNAQLLRLLLQERGHHGRLAKNGNQALALVESAEFDLVILDLRMPGGDGFAVMQRIRERRLIGKHLPVIALSARALEEDRERCFAAGMDDFLAKPIDAHALWAAIERLQPPQVRHGVRWIDAAVLLAACGSDAAILDRIRLALRTHLPAELLLAERSWRARDSAELREAGHRLCGMVAAASSAAGRIASDLEHAAAVGRVDEAGTLLRRLRGAVETLLDEIDVVTLECLKWLRDEHARD